MGCNRVRSRATAGIIKEFIDTMNRRMPFKIKAIEVDGEFYAYFENACKDKGIKLFVLPPKSPKLNGSIERPNRTHIEEFYEVNDFAWTVSKLNKQLRQWEHIYNSIRPHHSLGKITPLQFLKNKGIIINTKNPSVLSHT